MKDCLKEFCKNKSINLKYTKNKSAILSIDNQNKTPTIRIHKMFKNCSEDTADKIIQYYELYQSSYYLIRFIQDYFEEYYKKPENQKDSQYSSHINTFAKGTVQIKYNKPAPQEDKQLNTKHFPASYPYNISGNEVENTGEPEDIVVHKKGTVKGSKVLDVMLVNKSNIVFTFKSEKRSAIRGVVKLSDDSAAKNALVKLLLKKDKTGELTPVTSTFTDTNGEFYFKVNPGEYVLKIFYYDSELN